MANTDWAPLVPQCVLNLIPKPWLLGLFIIDETILDFELAHRSEVVPAPFGILLGRISYIVDQSKATLFWAEIPEWQLGDSRLAQRAHGSDGELSVGGILLNESLHFPGIGKTFFGDRYMHPHDHG